MAADGWTPVAESSGWTPVAESAPSASLVENMGMRDPGGYIESDAPSAPSDLISLLKSSAHPQSLADLLPLLVPNAASPVGETLAAWGASLRRVLPKTEGVKSIPIDMLKDLYRQAYPVENTARLTGDMAPKLNEVLSQALDDVRQADTLNTPAKAMGGSVRAVLARGLNVNPQIQSGEMVATLPDKWGMTAIQPADLAKMTPQRNWSTNLQAAEASISPMEKQLMDSAIARGISPMTAAKTLADNDPVKFTALVKLYLKPLTDKMQ